MKPKGKITTVMSGRKSRKNKGKKRNQRNGMQKKAAMDTLAKSMNKGFSK